MLKSFDSIEKHIEKHLIYGQRLKAHVCVVCRARFASIKLLNVHQKYYHEIGKALLLICDVRVIKWVVFFFVPFSDESNSKDSNTAAGHGKHRLADFFTMRCDFCDDVTFSTFQDARQHYQNTHEMRGYLVCCDRKFMKPKSVDDHFQWHINPEYLKYARSWVKQFIWKILNFLNLKKNYFIFFPTNCRCHYCGKCFSKKLVLATHISRHKAIEAKRFSCPKCDKAFESNHCLKKHVIVHDEEMKKTKNVPCPHCQKRYATERSLLCHIRYAHTRDRDGKGVICEICGKTFVSQSTVQTHIRIVHCTKSELDDRKVKALYIKLFPLAKLNELIRICRIHRSDSSAPCAMHHSLTSTGSRSTSTRYTWPNRSNVNYVIKSLRIHRRWYDKLENIFFNSIIFMPCSHTFFGRCVTWKAFTLNRISNVICVQKHSKRQPHSRTTLQRTREKNCTNAPSVPKPSSGDPTCTVTRRKRIRRNGNPKNPF